MAGRRKRRASAKGKPRGISKPFTPEQQRMVLQLVSATMYQSTAARHVGVTPQAVSNKKASDPEFALALDRADATAEFNLLAIVLKAATKDHKAAQWLLERKWPERWAKPEVRANLNLAQVDTAELVIAIQASLRMVAKSHASWDQPDVDAESVPAEGEEPAP